jgi:hypothetical protein
MTSKFDIATRQAEALGHDMGSGPPQILLTGIQRRTCGRCGLAVLGYENGTTWGSALEKPCQYPVKS